MSWKVLLYQERKRMKHFPSEYLMCSGVKSYLSEYITILYRLIISSLHAQLIKSSFRSTMRSAVLRSVIIRPSAVIPGSRCARFPPFETRYGSETGASATNTGEPVESSVQSGGIREMDVSICPYRDGGRPRKRIFTGFPTETRAIYNGSTYSSALSAQLPS